MKIIATLGGYAGYREFNNSIEGYEKAKKYIARQIISTNSWNWLIVKADKHTSTPLLNPVLPDDRKLMEKLVTTTKRRQLDKAILNY